MKDKGFYTEIVKLCLPVAEFMKKNCLPHETVIITDEIIKLVADEINFPVKEADE